MKDIGTVDEPQRFVGEELQVDVFDGADPTDAGTRRWWYRGDLSVNGSDAVIRVNNNGEIVDVPVYENSTSVEAGIDTRFGVVAPGLSEPAFVPLTDPADAAFDFGRIETPSGTELSLHNRTAPGSAIPDSGLIRRYQFNEGSGTTATDSEGSNDGTINGATYTTNAIEGSHALDFDGADDYVSAPSFSQFSAYTVVSWLYKDTFNAIENAWYFRENNSIGLRTRDTTVGSRAITNGIELSHDDGSSTVYAESEFDTGRWQMFAGTWDGSTVKLYRDESGSMTEKDSVSASGMGSSARGDAIGRNDNTQSSYWTGRQDDYLFYNRELSQSELQQIYDSVA